jgi:DNA-binding NarL/FixJ family response regulator
VALILVIDEHGLFRRGLRELIQANVRYSRVAEAADVAAGVSMLKSGRHFDLVLLGCSSVVRQSLTSLKEACSSNSLTRLAIVSTSSARTDVLSCLSAGFHGFVSKSLADEDILAAINDLLSGRIHVPNWLADCANRPEAVPTVDIGQDRFRITRRQNEVLSLLKQGMSNKEIAHVLNIAESTTKIHTCAVLRALGARNRTEAAFKAANLSETDNKPQWRLARLSCVPK